MIKDEILKMEAGLDLDVMLAERVMKWKRISINEPIRLHWEEGGYICDGIPYTFSGTANRMGKMFTPSRDYTDAWEVAEKLSTIGWLVKAQIMPTGSSWLNDEAHPVSNKHAYCDLSWVRIDTQDDIHKKIYIHPYSLADTIMLAIGQAALIADMEMQTA